MIDFRSYAEADLRLDPGATTFTGANGQGKTNLVEAANAVRMHTADYSAYYDRNYHEVRQHQHKRALVLTARKLVRLVVRLLA